MFLTVQLKRFHGSVRFGSVQVLKILNGLVETLSNWTEPLQIVVYNYKIDHYIITKDKKGKNVRLKNIPEDHRKLIRWKIRDLVEGTQMGWGDISYERLRSQTQELDSGSIERTFRREKQLSWARVGKLKRAQQTVSVSQSVSQSVRPFQSSKKNTYTNTISKLNALLKKAKRIDSLWNPRARRTWRRGQKQNKKREGANKLKISHLCLFPTGISPAIASYFLLLLLLLLSLSL